MTNVGYKPRVKVLKHIQVIEFLMRNRVNKMEHLIKTSFNGFYGPRAM